MFASALKSLQIQSYLFRDGTSLLIGCNFMAILEFAFSVVMAKGGERRDYRRIRKCEPSAVPGLSGLSFS